MPSLRFPRFPTHCYLEFFNLVGERIPASKQFGPSGYSCEDGPTGCQGSFESRGFNEAPQIGEHVRIEAPYDGTWWEASIEYVKDGVFYWTSNGPLHDLPEPVLEVIDAIKTGRL